MGTKRALRRLSKTGFEGKVIIYLGKLNADAGSGYPEVLLSPNYTDEVRQAPRGSSEL